MRALQGYLHEIPVNGSVLFIGFPLGHVSEGASNSHLLGNVGGPSLLSTSSLLIACAGAACHQPISPSSSERVWAGLEAEVTMELPLSELANTCVDYAAALDIFLENTGRESTIRDSIEDLLALSKVLYALYSGVGPLRYGRNVGLISHDLEVTVRSLQITFAVFKKMLANTRFTYPDGMVPYRALWDGMNHRLTQYEGVSFAGRLDRYNKFLMCLMEILRGTMPSDDLIHLRERMERLLQQQLQLDTSPRGSPTDQRPPPLRTQTQTPSAAKMPPMFRPPLNSFQTYPAAGVTPPPFENSSPTGRMPQSPASTGSMNSWDWTPPFVPDVPQSPAWSDSSQQTWNSSNNSFNDVPHWAPRLMSGRHPRTPFRSVGQPTKCDAREDLNAVQRLVKDGFIEVFKCSFPDAKASIKLLWRKDDHRCRMLFAQRDPRNQRPMFFCMPMVSLKLIRTDNCLQLCRYDTQNKQFQRWANLNFTDYERMTLFQCTYRAMKHQDSKRFPEQLLDYPNPSEDMEFAAEIRDDNYRHTLRIIRDTDSGCVRLEASARRGEMKGVPIWTAFVTDFIGSRTWMRLVGPNTVQLSQLHPYILCNYYTPSGQSDTGVFQLKFSVDKDAADFMQVFHHIY